jgi:glycosidase
VVKNTWWKDGVVYRIYPRSFHNSNVDGIGDLRGIVEKLENLQQLGVIVVWLCPVFQSPNQGVTANSCTSWPSIEAMFVMSFVTSRVGTGPSTTP